MNRLLVSVVLVVVFMTGCGSGFFSSGIDSKRDEYGNTILLDTSNNWDNWTRIVDIGVKHELAGVRPPGGLKSWNDSWLLSIEHLNEGHQENKGKYIEYIIESRKKAQLPPLK